MFKENEIYSYSEICRSKNEDVLKGNSKNAHIKKWCKYEEWERAGRKYKFIRYLNDEEILMNELDTTYDELLELFLFKYLGSVEGNTVELTISKFAENMCLRNKNFSHGRYNQYEILDLISCDKLIPMNNEIITKDLLAKFFENNEFNYHRKIKKVLYKMESMGLITYKKYLYVSYTKKGFSSNRLATEEEEKLLLDISNEVIRKFPNKLVTREDDGALEYVKSDKSNLTQKENFIFYKTVPAMFYKSLNERIDNGERYNYYYYKYEIILSQEQITSHIPYKLKSIQQAINIKAMRGRALDSFKRWFIDANTEIDIKGMLANHREKQL